MLFHEMAKKRRLQPVVPCLASAGAGAGAKLNQRVPQSRTLLHYNDCHIRSLLTSAIRSMLIIRKNRAGKACLYLDRRQTNLAKGAETGRHGKWAIVSLFSFGRKINP